MGQMLAAANSSFDQWLVTLKMNEDLSAHDSIMYLAFLAGWQAREGAESELAEVYGGLNRILDAADGAYGNENRPQCMQDVFSEIKVLLEKS